MKEELSAISKGDINSMINEVIEAIDEVRDRAFDVYAIINIKKVINHTRLELAPTKTTPSGKKLNKYRSAKLIDDNNTWHKFTIKATSEEENAIYLDVFDEQLLNKNRQILLFPQDFLATLRELWRKNEFAELAINSIDDLISPLKVTGERQIQLTEFDHLRKAQKEAFNLINFSSSFLWGPPGTGKSTTLGSLISRYLVEVPTARVLVLSTSHPSVDDIAGKIDEVLFNLNQHRIRLLINRHGAKDKNAINQRITSRRHLTYELSEEQEQKFLQKMHSRQPQDALSAIYSSIYDDDFEFREKGLKNIQRHRLICMTVAAAATNFEKLQDSGKFDLVVFEEAGQISLAYSLMLMALGKTRLFAGDPKQLPPVVDDDCSELVFNWLGRSIFEYLGKTSAVCMLDEQTRMAPPICELVSKTFYDGKLKFDQSYLTTRERITQYYIPFGEIRENIQLKVENILIPDLNSKNNPALPRKESADALIRILESKGSERESTNNIFVISPFIAQIDYLKKRLNEIGFIDIKLLTVHSSQGGEADVVFFDAGNGVSQFLRGRVSENLVNVALSRARKKLILLFSASDLQNKLLRQIADIVKTQGTKKTIPLGELQGAANWRLSGIGQRVLYKNMTMDIVDIVDNKIKFVDVAENRTKWINLNNDVITIIL